MIARVDGMNEKTTPLDARHLAISLPGAVIEVVEGPDTGRSAALTGRTLRVGTAHDNDLVMTDVSISRHHVELRLAADGVWVVDLGSTNGTFANGLKIEKAAAHHDLRIVIGQSALRFSQSASSVSIPISNRDRFGGLVGRSLAMRELYAMLERAAPTDASILLHGETGTGKELAAEAIHGASARADGPFIVVDCGAIPVNLFESEMFGHVRGSFSGAIGNRTGLLEEANGGTVFLDEIGELAPELQPKLLRALERRQIRPVGSSRTVDVDVRVVAATHRDLQAEVNHGSFREDLYFRLAVVRLTIPPLRDRRDDLNALIRLFVERMAPARVSEVPSFIDHLRHRSFPGNVRELRNAVEELLILGRANEFRTETPSEPTAPSLPDAIYEMPYKEASEAMLRTFQRDYVERLLTRTNNNVSTAAREAGMSRRYLQNLMARLALRGGDE
jgi:DNA-binding NtrC family response regulator